MRRDRFMTMKHMRLLGLVFLLGLSFSGCGGGSHEESPPKETKKSEPPKTPEKPTYKGEKTQVPAIASLKDNALSGNVNGSIKVRFGDGENSRSQDSPGTGMEFLLVQVMVSDAGILVPSDYRVVIDEKPFTPHAIALGLPTGEYASVEHFLGKQIKLVPGDEDKWEFNNEGRIGEFQLEYPSVIFAYEVPKGNPATFWHGMQSKKLTPNWETFLAEVENSGGTLTVSDKPQIVDFNATSEEYSPELLSSKRTRILLNDKPSDVVILSIKLSTTKEIKVDLTKSNLALRGKDGGGGAGGMMYFHFSNGFEQNELTGSLYTPGETYKPDEGKREDEKPLYALNTGGFRVPLSPNSPVTVLMIIPDPKVDGDLELHLTPSVALNIPEPVNPLGKFPPPVDKMPGMVARTPLMGTPIYAGFLSEQASVAANSKQLASPSSANPKGDSRYLVVRFRVAEETPFAPIDYRVADGDTLTIYRPLAVAFGESPIYVKGLDYEEILLAFGSATAPVHKAGQLTGWALKKPEVTLLYEVPASKSYVFLHGITQFVIEL